MQGERCCFLVDGSVGSFVKDFKGECNAESVLGDCVADDEETLSGCYWNNEVIYTTHAPTSAEARVNTPCTGKQEKQRRLYGTNKPQEARPLFYPPE